MHFWPYLTALRPNLFLDFFAKMVIYQHYGNVLIGQNYENEVISKKYDENYVF
jgi:hypothetical protein